MGKRGAGRCDREGLTIVQLIRKFPDDAAAKAWFEATRWPEGPYCPHCGSFNVQCNVKHPRMTHRCRDCSNRPFFSLRTGTPMEGSNLGYQTWVLAIYLLTTSLKGVSSMKLSRDLGVCQKTAWYMAHRLRKVFDGTDQGTFTEDVEADESYFGGRKKRGIKGRGGVGKAIVAGVKGRDTRQVKAKVVENVQRTTLHQFVNDRVDPDVTVYTDELKSYTGVAERHETVNHTAREYVREKAHTNGIESFWSMMKRAYDGTYHKLSHKHMQRYVDEFTGRHNMRDLDTKDQMALVSMSMVGKSLRFKDLIEDNGLPSGARGGVRLEEFFK